ncbi:MAG: hypothetical protein Q9159_003406 [Coniocarpon cinnabarinum]
MLRPLEPSSQRPTTIPPPSPTTSGTDALPSSSTIPLAPPTTTADGLYLVNFNSTRDPKNIGSIFAYFNHFDLTANIGQAPDASTFVANGRYANWEDNRYTEFGPFALILGFLGIFSDQVYFTSEINVSSAAAASLPVNAPCGVGANGNQTTGAFYRNFTIYKSEEILLYTDQKNGTQLHFDFPRSLACFSSPPRLPSRTEYKILGEDCSLITPGSRVVSKITKPEYLSGNPGQIR